MIKIAIMHAVFKLTKNIEIVDISVEIAGQNQLNGVEIGRVKHF